MKQIKDVENFDHINLAAAFTVFVEGVIDVEIVNFLTPHEAVDVERLGGLHLLQLSLKQQFQRHSKFSC